MSIVQCSACVYHYTDERWGTRFAPIALFSEDVLPAIFGYAHSSYGASDTGIGTNPYYCVCVYILYSVEYSGLLYKSRLKIVCKFWTIGHAQIDPILDKRTFGTSSPFLLAISLA